MADAGMHDGHRNRMYEKMYNADMMNDHELLEILLFAAIPRKNTNFIAHRMIEKFGSVEKVFHADYASLKEIEGLGRDSAAYIECLGVFYRRYMERKEGIKMPTIFERDSFKEYLAARFHDCAYEILELYFVSPKGTLLSHRAFTSQSKKKVDVLPTEVTAEVMRNAGNYMVLAHNHVNSTNEPSSNDDELTKQCAVLCSINNVVLLDHMICGSNGVFSYYEAGKMQAISREYHIRSILDKDEEVEK